MATIKSYTDIEQSKKLAEILPLESADMTWVSCDDGKQKYYQAENRKIILNYEKNHWLPCWSLSVLLSVLPKEVEIDGQRYAPCLFPIQDKWLLKLWYNSNHTFTSPITIFSDNPVDACVDMIIKLNELKML